MKNVSNQGSLFFSDFFHTLLASYWAIPQQCTLSDLILNKIMYYQEIRGKTQIILYYSSEYFFNFQVFASYISNHLMNS